MPGGLAVGGFICRAINGHCQAGYGARRTGDGGWGSGKHNDGAAGDGVYGNSFIGTQFGIYRLQAEARGSWDGIPFARTDFSEVQVASGTATIAGPISDQGVDEDGDGRFDVLRIAVPLQVTDAGDYMISGELRSSADLILEMSSASGGLDAGRQTLMLDFSGEGLWAMADSSPFKLTNLGLLDLNTDDLPIKIDFKALAHTTQQYDQDDFQHEGIYLSGATHDFGVEEDGNGKFDELVVEVEVDLSVGGNYAWQGQLVDAGGDLLGTSSAEAILAAGVNEIAFRFDGKAIGDNHRRGPYYLVNLELWGTSGYAKNLEAAQTAAYSHRQFESSSSGGELYLPLVSRG